MADNILKNEFMWEEKQAKKKLYKNWKLYAIALGIIVIGTGIGLGVYYGVYENHSEVTKIDLSTLELNKTISGKENMNQEDAFQSFLNANKEITNLENNIETKSFTTPTYTESGSLEINATATGKYSGTITVTINAIEQTKLTNLNLNTKLPNSTTDKQEAFQTFLDLNQEKYPDLKDNIEAGTFIAPTHTVTGSLEINATATGKYGGTIQVSIPTIPLTEREKILQKIKDAYQNKDDETWYASWETYLSFIKDETLNSFTYVLTNEELTNNTKVQEIIFDQFRTTVIAELTKWNIPKGYDENSIKISYSNFNIANGTITANGQIYLNIKSIDYDNNGLSDSWHEDFQYTATYVVED